MRNGCSPSLPTSTDYCFREDRDRVIIFDAFYSKKRERRLKSQSEPHILTICYFPEKGRGHSKLGE